MDRASRRGRRDDAGTRTTGVDPFGDPYPEDGPRVAVDQVGYLPGAEKVAVVTAPAETFRVRLTGEGTVVHEGELSGPREAEAAGETVRHADFSTFDERGTYLVETDAGDRSYPFRIEAGLYDPVLVDAVRVYTLKRTNTRIDDPLTGLELPPGHTQDAEARTYFGDDVYEQDRALDVSGGWYDAGDYGKYVPPAAVAVAQLLLAYELYPGAFEAGQLDLPPGVSEPERYRGLPDLLAEAKFELEWLLRMQRPDGACFHKVAGAEWADFHDAPTEDTQPRYVFGMSTYGTAMVAGAAALGARVYRDSHPGFANGLLEAAREAFAYLEATPEPAFRFDEGQDDGSGPYRKEGDAGERFWAAAELLKTTGEARYADYLAAELAEQFDAAVGPPVWSDALSLGQWAYATADAADPDRRATLESAFLACADDLVATVDAEGYRCALAVEDYHWASTKLALAKGTLLLLANELSPDGDYVAAALDQLHYALGRTPTGYSYVTGTGSNPVEHPHDRIVASTGVTIPGMVVSGANRNGDDPLLEEFLEAESPPPAKAFVDVFGAYSATEWAVDYSAPLVFVLAAVVADPPD